MPVGAEVDEYYGITSGRPKQSPEEGARGEHLIAARKPFSEGQPYLSPLFGEIQDHDERSEIDPELLRAPRPPRNKEVE